MPSSLVPVDRELILKYATSIWGHDPDLFSRVRAEIDPNGNSASNLLHLLEPPHGGERELVEIYRRVFDPNPVTYASLEAIDRAIRTFIQKVHGRQVQVTVFRCIFLLLLHTLDNAESFDQAFESKLRDMLHYISVNCSADFRCVGKHTIRIRWDVDLGYIEFRFPPFEVIEQDATFIDEQNVTYIEAASVRDHGFLAANGESVFVGGPWVLWRYDHNLSFKERIILLPPDTYRCNRLQLANEGVYAAAENQVLEIKLEEMIPLNDLPNLTRENLELRFRDFSATSDRFIDPISITSFQHPEMRNIFAVAVDLTNGCLYASDLSMQRLFKLSTTGDFLWQQFLQWQPLDVAVDPAGEIWVTYGMVGKIQKFAADGSLLATYDYTFTAYGIDVAGDGSLWFSDHGGGHLVHLNPEGKVMGSIDKLVRPTDVVVASNGAVYAWTQKETVPNTTFIIKFISESSLGD